MCHPCVMHLHRLIPLVILVCAGGGDGFSRGISLLKFETQQHAASHTFQCSNTWLRSLLVRVVVQMDQACVGPRRNTSLVAPSPTRAPAVMWARTHRVPFKLKVCAILSAMSISITTPQISRIASLLPALPLGVQKTTLVENSLPREYEASWCSLSQHAAPPTSQHAAWSTYESVVCVGVAAVTGALSTLLIVGRRDGPTVHNDER